MSHENIDVLGFLDLIYTGKVRSEVELYEYLNYKTKEFDKQAYCYFKNDIRSYANHIKVFSFEDFDKIFSMPEIDIEIPLHENIIKLKKLYPLGYYPNSSILIKFSIMAESFEINDSFQNESESLNEAKTILTRRQKIALLEKVGVMKFLENVFAGNQTQMSKFLSLIIDNDQQNIRKDINKDTESLLSDPKISNIINPILQDLGLIVKE